jgi:hypothetical protein
MLVKGRFVVGCTDVMIGGSSQEDGCFLRIFYPSKLTDTYVGKQRDISTKKKFPLNLFIYIGTGNDKKKKRKILMTGQLGYRTKSTKKVTQSSAD